MCGLLVLVDPSLFDPGSHFLHLRVIGSQLSAAHRALADDGTPLPLLNGVVLVVAAIGAAGGRPHPGDLGARAVRAHR